MKRDQILTNIGTSIFCIFAHSFATGGAFITLMNTIAFNSPLLGIIVFAFGLWAAWNVKQHTSKLWTLCKKEIRND